MIYWLASYPRSGNTFFRSVLNHYFGKQSYSVHGDTRDIQANARLSELVGHADGDRSTLDFKKLRKSSEPFFIKTHHLPREYMSTDDAVLHVVRDGRDATTSFLNYLHNIVNLRHLSLQDVITGRVVFGFWGNHTLKWIARALTSTNSSIPL